MRTLYAAYAYGSGALIDSGAPLGASQGDRPAPSPRVDGEPPPYEWLDRPLELDDWHPLHGPQPTD